MSLVLFFSLKPRQPCSRTERTKERDDTPPILRGADPPPAAMQEFWDRRQWGRRAVQGMEAGKTGGGGSSDSERGAGCLLDKYGLCPVKATVISSSGKSVNDRHGVCLRGWAEKEKVLLWQVAGNTVNPTTRADSGPSLRTSPEEGKPAGTQMQRDLRHTPSFLHGSAHRRPWRLQQGPSVVTIGKEGYFSR